MSGSVKTSVKWQHFFLVYLMFCAILIINHLKSGTKHLSDQQQDDPMSKIAESAGH